MDGQQYARTSNVAKTDYLAFGYESQGQEYHLIFNNNGGGSQFDGPVITTGNDFYYNVTATECKDITHKIYVDDQPSDGEAAAIYAWGDGIAELYGGWPGKSVYGTETIGGVKYKVFTFPATGQVYNPIYNNNGGGSQCEADLPLRSTRITSSPLRPRAGQQNEKTTFNRNHPRHHAAPGSVWRVSPNAFNVDNTKP